MISQSAPDIHVPGVTLRGASQWVPSLMLSYTDNRLLYGHDSGLVDDRLESSSTYGSLRRARNAGKWERQPATAARVGNVSGVPSRSAASW